MLIILLMCAPAFAQPVLLRVRAVDLALSAPVEVQIGGSNVQLRDDGGAPDPFGGDGLWSGVVAGSPSEGPQTLTVSDARGRSWTTEVAWPTEDPAELDLVLDEEGGLSRAEAPVMGAVQTPASAQAAPALGGSATPTAGAGAMAWAVAALGWGLALSLGGGPPASPSALNDCVSPLGDHRYRVSHADLPQALDALARQHRLLLVGLNATLPGTAVAYSPDSADPGDVAAALRDLEGRGRALVVVARVDDESELPALFLACRGLAVVVVASAAVPGTRPLPLPLPSSSPA